MRKPLLVRVEDILRNQIAAQMLPTIRARFPRLHHFLLSLRDHLIPLPGDTRLSRYQYRAVQKFISLAEPNGALDSVLEIGSDMAGQVMNDLAAKGAKMVVGVNPIVDAAHASEELQERAPVAHMSQCDARWLPFADTTFTAIFSVAAFEHIQNFDDALLELHRVLKDGGVLYAEFGPIWSCSVGHHVFAQINGEEARHWKPGLNPVPHFGHLLLAPDEMENTLRDEVSPELLEAIIDWIYKQEDINRLFYEDYIRILNSSPFDVISIQAVRERVPRRIQEELTHRYPGYQEFGCRIIEVSMRRR